jgi:hypothetical protein
MIQTFKLSVRTTNGFRIWFEGEKRKGKTRSTKARNKIDAKYMGGHNACPTRKEVKTKILVFADRIEIYSKMFILTVKYNQMTNIENLGNYTIIEYNDGMDSHALTLDFGKHLEKMQPVIYHKWIGARVNKQGLT